MRARCLTRMLVAAVVRSLGREMASVSEVKQRLLMIAGDPRAVEQIRNALQARNLPMRDGAASGEELDQLRQREAIRAVLQEAADLVS